MLLMPTDNRLCKRTITGNIGSSRRNSDFGKALVGRVTLRQKKGRATEQLNYRTATVRFALPEPQ